MPQLVNNTALTNQFKNVELYVDYKDAKAHNFEALFSLQNSTGGDPDVTSLFNLDTLQMLLNTSAGMPDIVDKPDQFQHTIDLSGYQKVTDRLKLNSNEQTYVLYLWLLYCRKTTFAREMNTKDPSYSVLSNIG